MEDIVKGSLLFRLQERLLHFFASLLQVGAFTHHLLHSVVAQLEAADRGAADILRVGLSLHHEGLVIEDCSRNQPLNDKLFRHALIVGY